MCSRSGTSRTAILRPSFPASAITKIYGSSRATEAEPCPWWCLALQNSSLQLLFTVPEVQRQYLGHYPAIAHRGGVGDPAADLMLQVIIMTDQEDQLLLSHPPARVPACYKVDAAVIQGLRSRLMRSRGHSAHCRGHLSLP
jgi:hypothetical protein